MKDRPCFQGQVGKLDDLMCRGAFMYYISYISICMYTFIFVYVCILVIVDILQYIYF